MKKTFKKELTLNRRNEINPKVAKLIDKLSKKYAGVWKDLAKV